MQLEQFEDRWYQIECTDAAIADVEAEFNPISVVPTGAGKSVIICKIIDEYLTKYPHKDVLVVSHVSDILEQNYNKLYEYIGNSFLGLYSAGLSSREMSKVTVAGVQSIYNKKKLLAERNVGLIIVDECHMINSKDAGMYRKLLKNIPDAVCCGVTATPFRTGQGYIYKAYKGFNPIFNKLSYDLSSYENYNRLVDEGYLCPLVPAPTDFVMDTTGVRKVGGEYDSSELSDRFDREEITKKCISKIIKYARTKYKKWLIFAIDIEHAKHIVAELRANNVTCEAVHSSMERSKKEVMAEYRAGEITALVNVNMLTTGLDIPTIDLIAHLRPSQSAIFHVQSNGRGGRPAPGKSHCLVLDFAGNTQRHGPINDVEIVEPGDKKKGGAGIMAKECPNCQTLNSLRAKFCIACYEEFKIQHKLNADASSIDVIKTSDKTFEDWVNVHDVIYSIHTKPGAPNSLRVTYLCGFNQFSEWVHPNNSGWVKARANKWTLRRFVGKGELPLSLDKLYNNTHLLRRPSSILVNIDKKRKTEIKDFRWDKGDNLPEEKPKLFEKKLTKSQIDFSEFDDDIPF